MAKKSKLPAETVKLSIDGQQLDVPKIAYIKSKTIQLKEFGYSSLTEKDVSDALEKALAGNAKDVISMFIESDLQKKSNW